MENKENIYNKGKIYKIVSPSHPNLIYYGSTVQALSVRFGGHKRRKQESLKYQNVNSYTSEQILQYEDATIYLVENFSCNSKEELRKREG